MPARFDPVPSGNEIRRQVAGANPESNLGITSINPPASAPDDPR